MTIVRAELQRKKKKFEKVKTAKRTHFDYMIVYLSLHSLLLNSE
jgi:hypothetical protein